ncbi:MAG: hypothetical protein PHO90_00470 [Candidatus Pacebacteria bacterium]|nr:hypothetical protein [Candidatus Paceibacterota bacterium]
MAEQNFNNQQMGEQYAKLMQSALKQVGDKKEEKKTKKKKEPDIVLEAEGRFVLTDGAGNEIESGQAKIALDEEKISILSESGKATPLLLGDISELVAEDFKIDLSLSGGGKTVISELGYKYDDLVRELTKFRHEIIQKELLMKEGGGKGSFKGNYVCKKDGKESSGEAEVEVSDTGLTIKPKKGDLIRISFAEINDFSKKDYAISITAESVEVVLSHFGERFDSLSQAISESLNELSLKTQEILKRILSESDPLTIKKASELLKDGQAVSKEAIDKVSSSIWSALEKKLGELEIKESYDYLMSLSKTKQVFLGIKRDLMGDLTGEYIWFLIPVNSQKGEFLAMEAASTAEGGSKATYFFKIPESEKAEALVKKINSCMIAINFRREPIYLKDEDLDKPEYSKYKTAVGRIPELKLLRQLFAGRVVHSSPEEWKKSVNELIS